MHHPHCHIVTHSATIILNTQGDYQAFFCRSHDPWYIKKLKMEILTLMACSTNAYDIVSEWPGAHAALLSHPN